MTSGGGVADNDGMRALTASLAATLGGAALLAHAAGPTPRLYFLDVRGGRVVSANTDGSDTRTLVTGLRGTPDGIVVDAAAGYIYWTHMGRADADDGYIQRARLDGRELTKIVPDGGTFTMAGRKLSGLIELTISDTGIGISAEDQAAIFEKFGQLGRVDLHSSGKTKFKGGGPGLGLPIARGILEAHGGTIWVESPGYDEIRNPGSTFHIMIPDRTESPDPKMSKLFDTLGKNKNEEMVE